MVSRQFAAGGRRRKAVAQAATGRSQRARPYSGEHAGVRSVHSSRRRSGARCEDCHSGDSEDTTCEVCVQWMFPKAFRDFRVTEGPGRDNRPRDRVSGDDGGRQSSRLARVALKSPRAGRCAMRAVVASRAHAPGNSEWIRARLRASNPGECPGPRSARLWLWTNRWKMDESAVAVHLWLCTLIFKRVREGAARARRVAGGRGERLSFDR